MKRTAAREAREVDGGALFLHGSSNDGGCGNVSRAHPSLRPTVRAAPARAANDASSPLLFDAGEWTATVAATLDAAGELRAVAWVPPAEPAPVRRRRDPAAEKGNEGDDLTNWRALFAAAGFSLEDAGDDDEAGDEAAAVFLAAAPVQRVVFAEDVQRTRRARPAVPVSVFDLAAKPALVCIAAASTVPAARCRQVERGDGVIRCTTVAIQDTPEWAEKERQRRARQRPPRPVKAAKTRSKKLEQLIGEAA